MKYAAEHDVHLYCENGANLNTVFEDVLQNLAQYRFRSIFCSIDGTWQFIVFPHNEHQVGLARNMVSQLGMGFFTKPSWGAGNVFVSGLGPVLNGDKMRRARLIVLCRYRNAPALLIIRASIYHGVIL